MSVKILFFLLIAYLVGSINPATLLTHVLLKKDIRDFGDGNPGSTNVFLHINKVTGSFVFFLDASKGFIPLYLANRAGFSGLQLAVIDSFAIVGHNFPVFHSFKGGTGISSFIGGLLFIYTTLTVQVLLFVSTLILVMYVLKTKIQSSYSALEIGEAVGFLVILYFAYISKDYTFKTYAFLTTLVVILRRFDKIFCKKDFLEIEINIS